MVKGEGSHSSGGGGLASATPILTRSVATAARDAVASVPPPLASLSHPPPPSPRLSDMTSSRRNALPVGAEAGAVARRQRLGGGEGEGGGGAELMRGERIFLLSFFAINF